ncbi:hypothetical protein bthur0005_8830 [Bacillus thuringiensis serovar pakistani str. T13001]|nr:hypothetical protein bthur0005_8830 [Bacillus thuringiensis serovar pakistani str. T13001]
MKLYSKQYCYCSKVKQTGQPRFQTVRLDVGEIGQQSIYRK